MLQILQVLACLLTSQYMHTTQVASLAVINIQTFRTLWALGLTKWL